MKLTRKEMPFYWTEFHQKAFEQVKELLIKLPVYIYLDLEVDSYYIVIPLSPTQIVLYGKCKMANLDY